MVLKCSHLNANNALKSLQQSPTECKMRYTKPALEIFKLLTFYWYINSKMDQTLS